VTSRVPLVVAIAVGWPAFAWSWWRVVQTHSTPTAAAVAMPFALAALTAIVTVWWVRHNRAIYRRKGPRRAVPVAAFPYLQDRRRRPLALDRQTLGYAREIVVSVDADGVKHYEDVAP
jgi:hypothetical protein